MARVVVDMNDKRPVWAPPGWFAEEIRRAVPSDWSLKMLDTETEGTADGVPVAAPQVLEAVRDAEVFMGFGILGEVLEAGPGIRWVHTGSAGVSSSITPQMLKRNPVFTNSAGIHGPPMAEAVIGMLLHFFRCFDFAIRAQRRGEWDTDPFYRADCPARELGGSTVGIVGYGGIGRDIATRLAAMGVHILGLRRTPQATPAPEGTEILWGDQGLDRLLRESDAVVLTAPDTAETRGLFDRDAFERMKPGAVLINVARGSIVDDRAMIDALRSGRLRGAGLDVFTTEPLPSDSPLWDLENVLITPHVSPVTDRFWRRETDLIVHNLRCWVEDRTDEMRNVVDLSAGY